MRFRTKAARAGVGFRPHRLPPSTQQVNNQEQRQEPVRLKAGQIGLLGLTALAIGAVSPALGLFALWGPMEAAAGPVSPLVFLGAAILALPTAISYAVMNQEAPSAGAASTWLWRAVSAPTGYLIGLTMTTYFIFVVCTMPLLFGVFFRDLMEFFGLPDLGIETLLIAISLVTIPVMWLAYRGAEVSTRAAVMLMAVESAVVVALSATILYVKSRAPGGIDLEPFKPHSASHGVLGYWTAMLLGVLAYAGFDVVSTAAEETHAPKEQVPKAILLTIAGVTIFWVLNSWAFSLGISPESVIEYSARGLSSVTPLASSYWGRGRILVILSAFTGIFAVYITTVLGASRIVFALARHGLLPSALAVLAGPKRIPIRALHAVFAVVLSADVTMVVLLGNGLAAFTWSANCVVFFACITFTAVNIANLLYFRRFKRQEVRLVANGLIPIAGTVLTVYVLYQSFFVSLWVTGGTVGRTQVVFCCVLFGALVLNVGLVATLAPRRFKGQAPIEAN
jgi:amino acid transporter